MGDFAAGTESVNPTPEGIEASGPVEQQPQPSEGGHPAWHPIREQLDPISFSKIEPLLKDMDKSANTRIESVNQQLKEYSTLGTPDQLKSYATLAQRIESEPEVIYEALGNFLRQNGRMPSEEELAEEVDEVEADQEDQQEDDPRLLQLQQQQEQLMQMIQQQQEQEAAAAADAEFEQEIDALKQAHPEFGDADIQEILQRAAFVALQDPTKEPAPLETFAAQYIEFRNRILSTPRPGDSAPKLLPTTAGGVPGSPAASQPSFGKMSRDDIQNVIASLVSQSNG